MALDRYSSGLLGVEHPVAAVTLASSSKGCTVHKPRTAVHPRPSGLKRHPARQWRQTPLLPERVDGTAPGVETHTAREAVMIASSKTG